MSQISSATRSTPTSARRRGATPQSVAASPLRARAACTSAGLISVYRRSIAQVRWPVRTATRGMSSPRRKNSAVARCRISWKCRSAGKEREVSCDCDPARAGPQAPVDEVAQHDGVEAGELHATQLPLEHGQGGLLGFARRAALTFPVLVDQAADGGALGHGSHAAGSDVVGPGLRPPSPSRAPGAWTGRWPPDRLRLVLPAPATFRWAAGKMKASGTPCAVAVQQILPSLISLEVACVHLSLHTPVLS